MYMMEGMLLQGVIELKGKLLEGVESKGNLVLLEESNTLM
jgi:hypothetical protein